MVNNSNEMKTEITLKGSVAIVSDFFFTAINSILYQRGIYMPETFKRESKYGLTVLTTTDEGLLRYLKTVQQQVTEWLMLGNIQRLVVVVKGVETLETLERWQFNVSIEDSAGSENETPNRMVPEKGQKSIKDIHNEIQAIIRQITASVTFLPLLQESCTFDLLVYTDKNVEAPKAWAESDPCYIQNSAEVKLRSFTTTVHKVDSLVAYKDADEWDL